MSFPSVTQVVGGWTPGKDTCNLINRTGAALAKGDLVALNLDFAATSGQAMVGPDPSLIETDGATGYVFGAAISPTTENVCRLMAVSLGTVADNAYGEFGIRGIFDVKMNGANKGEYITGTNAQVYGTPLTRTEVLALTTGVSNIVGVALADTSGVATGKCLFNGEAWRVWSAGDT